ncbi:MAG: DNA polymerase III subunit delta [Oscillospiraceae bacterium]
MTFTSQKQLLEAVKGGQSSNFYLIYGNEPNIKRNTLNKLLDIIVDKNFTDMNFHVFSGDEVDVDKLADTAENLPLFSETRTVLVDGFSFSYFNEEASKKLWELLGNIPPYTILIFYIGDEDFPSAQKSNGKKLLEFAKKSGVEVLINKLSEKELVSYIKLLGRKYNSAIPTGLCQYIIEACGGDSQNVKNECEKIFALAKDREVTKKDIDDLIILPVTASAFDIIKKISEKNFSDTMKILSKLFGLREPALKILGAIEMGFIDVYRCKSGVLEGKTQKEIADDFGYRQMFRVQKATSLGKSFSFEYLQGAISFLTKADMELKTTSKDEKLILEKMITEIFMLNR